MLTDNGPTDDDLAAYTDDRDPVVHPIDTEAVSRALRAVQGPAWGPNDMDLLNQAVPALCDALTAAEHRATRAGAQSEARRINAEYWKETALQERGAALDLLEQIKGRDQRIKAVRDVLDQAHDEFENANDAIIRRALDA